MAELSEARLTVAELSELSETTGPPPAAAPPANTPPSEAPAVVVVAAGEEEIPLGLSKMEQKK